MEEGTAQQQASAETLQAALQKTLELDSQREDLVSRANYAEGAQTALWQRNKALEQQVSILQSTNPVAG